MIGSSRGSMTSAHTFDRGRSLVKALRGRMSNSDIRHVVSATFVVGHPDHGPIRSTCRFAYVRIE